MRNRGTIPQRIVIIVRSFRADGWIVSRETLKKWRFARNAHGPGILLRRGLRFQEYLKGCAVTNPALWLKAQFCQNFNVPTADFFIIRRFRNYQDSPNL